MNINSLNKDDMASHLAEVIDAQDSKIFNLHQEKKVLWILLGILFTYNILL